MAKWAFGRFPPMSITLLEDKFGDTVPAFMNDLKEYLGRYRLTEEETKVTEKALDQLLFFTIVFYDDLE